MSALILYIIKINNIDVDQKIINYILIIGFTCDIMVAYSIAQLLLALS